MQTFFFSHQLSFEPCIQSPQVRVANDIYSLGEALGCMPLKVAQMAAGNPSVAQASCTVWVLRYTQVAACGSESLLLAGA